MLRNRIYYRVKPFLPDRLRLALRRWFTRRLRRHVGHRWPILPGSEQPPEAWPGWPGDHRFAVVLTHDVEGQSGLEKCRALMALEKRLGFRSSFNFIPEGSYRVPAELREELVAEGFEVGIHDLKHDGRLYHSRRDFEGHARRINQYMQEWGAVGFRSGFMLHKLAWLHQLDITYDASTFDTDPFEPQPEGRNTIFPFWVAQASGSRSGRGGYVELPYTLPQDSTLFLHMGESTIDIWKQKLDWVASHGGMALVNVHPDYMFFGDRGEDDGHGRRYPAEFYAEFLEFLKTRYQDQYWLALPREAAGYAADYLRRVPSAASENRLDASRTA